MAIELIDVIKKLAELHGTTLAEEVDNHNAEIAQRIASGYAHPIVSEEERLERSKAVKRRWLDKMMGKRAAARATKPKPTAEEIAGKAAAKAERDKASRRRHRVKARDALRALRKETGGPAKRKNQRSTAELTSGERRARKAEADKRYRLATREAFRGFRYQLRCVLEPTTM